MALHSTTSPSHSRSGSLETLGGFKPPCVGLKPTQHVRSGSAGRPAGTLPPLPCIRVVSGRRTVQVSASSGSMTVTAPELSAHPDAIKRREAAEARRAQRDAEAKQRIVGSAMTATGAPPNLPVNASYVTTLAAFQNSLTRPASEEQQLLVVFFSAPWCHGCRSMYSKFQQIATNNPDIKFLQVNVADEQLREHLATSLGLSKLPYFHIYHGQDLVSQFSANITKVGRLRAEIAAHKECLVPACAE